LSEEPSGIHVDIEREGSTLLIAFGGIKGRFAGIPAFEFFSLIARENPAVKRVFVRDLKQAWYQRGVERVGANVPEVATRLREIVATAEAERVVAIGASAGGFGAILFGTLVEATEVHAFSPQTFIGRAHRALYLDFRNRSQIAALREVRGGVDRRYLDLKRVVARAGAPTRYVIHYPARNRLDARHALRMRSLPGVALRAYAMAGHNVVGRLREEGALPALLETIISG
jgi:hypothetical protein